MSARAARRTRSDLHPAVQSYRQKIDSLGEHQLADIRSLGARVREAARTIPLAAGQAPPSRVPRDEPSGQAPARMDERREDDAPIPIDVVELEDA